MLVEGGRDIIKCHDEWIIPVVQNQLIGYCMGQRYYKKLINKIFVGLICV